MPKEIVKMKQGMSYSCKEKTIILNVFKYFRRMYPDKSITELIRRTSKATGCSEKSIFQFRKEEASPEGFKEPCKSRIRRNININSRFMKYDESVRESIKFIIYNLKCNNVIPSLNTIRKNVNSDQKLPNFSRTTLRRLLFDMGYTYEKDKTGNNFIFVEKSMDIKDNVEESIKHEIVKNNICSQPVIVKSTPNQNSSKNSVTPKNGPQVPVQILEPLSQNHVYLSNQTHVPRQIPLHCSHSDNSLVEPVSLGFQHTMMLSSIVPQSMQLTSNMRFVHHSH